LRDPPGEQTWATPRFFVRRFSRVAGLLRTIGMVIGPKPKNRLAEPAYNIRRLGGDAGADGCRVE